MCSTSPYRLPALEAIPAARQDLGPNSGPMSHSMHHAVTGVMDYETRIPGRPGQSGRGPGQHPSGFFWFHPHSHGYKGPLFAGAMTGAISIGDLSDYACARDGRNGCAPGRPVTLRYLLLKDAQVAPQGKGWRLLYARDPSLEDDCASGGLRGAGRPGECSDFTGRRWLFTVNGLRDPRITDVEPGRTEVWRIVNASANVTYRLSLLPKADVNGRPLPFTILSLAGAAPEPDGWAQPEQASEVLLMPGARAEIAIAPPPSGGDYALTQLGFASGGDVWPAVRLASISFPVAVGHAPKPIELHGEPSAFPRERFYAPADNPPCGFENGAIRRIYFVQRPAFADDRRRLPLYGVIAAVEKPGQAPVMYDAAGRATLLTANSWRALLGSDPAAPAFMHNPFGAVCTYLGHTETWIIENDTDEDHDFHIHQSEFQLDLAHRNDPKYFSADPPSSNDTLLASSDAAVAAADGRGREAAEAILYHDTIPVPRGVSLGGRGCDGSPMNPNCRPGRVAITLRFFRDEQVGTFVYHCHITQHEDGGMMGVVKVLCPPDDDRCRASHPQ